MKWAELNPPATPDEYNKWPTPRLIFLARRRAAHDARIAEGPTYRLRRLAWMRDGTSMLFADRRAGNELSRLLLNVTTETGAEFSTHVQRSVIDGEIEGVRVTLTKRATHGAHPEPGAEGVNVNPGPWPDVTPSVTK